MPKPTRKQIWSNLDVFGLLNGLATWDDQYKSLKYVRKPFEGNLSIKDRIYANHDYAPDVDKQGILNGLCGEFGLVPYNVKQKTVFELSFPPVPSGSSNEQDIYCFYKDPSGVWQNLGKQVWSEGYELSKQNKDGFIVWQSNRTSNIEGYKNFGYSTIAEVLSELPDETQVKFEYYIQMKDADNNISLSKYTDMNNQTDPNDIRFTYRLPQNDPDVSGNIVIYTLNDIPEGLKNTQYYDSNGMARDFLYSLKDYIDRKFKHTWDKAKDGTTLWDIGDTYGSGHIPSFYDALSPNNAALSGNYYTGYRGGVEHLSYAVYPEKLIEASGLIQQWYLKIYPGKFYVDGIPFYFFESPQVNYLNFSLVDGQYEASIPSGLTRGMYTIMAKSGYYNDYVNMDKDVYLTGVYEDYNYFTGEEGCNCWSDIYRRTPAISLRKGGIDLPLDIGQYKLDFVNNKIYAQLIPGYEKAVLVWDEAQVPSGFLLTYDFNPLNDKNLTFEKFFIYLATDSNRR